MKKNIKDYLHLYIGCETDQGLLIGMVNCDNDKEDIQCVCLMKEGGLVNGSIKNIKPILRPLSDMTEEEALECYESCWQGHQIDDVNKARHIRELFSEESDPDYAYGNVTGNAKVFRWALFKGFDLFGLVEAGLAIDKTTLKQTA